MARDGDFRYAKKEKRGRRKGRQAKIIWGCNTEQIPGKGVWETDEMKGECKIDLRSLLEGRWGGAGGSVGFGGEGKEKAWSGLDTCSSKYRRRGNQTFPY